MNRFIQSHNYKTSGAGTKDWLDTMAGYSILAYEPSYANAVERKPMLSSGPLTISDIEIGRTIADQYGLTE